MFDSIDDLRKHLNDSDLIDDSFPKVKDSPQFECIDCGNGRMKIVESFNYCNSVYAYRGQNKRYIPCVSSLQRVKNNQLDEIIYKSKLEELKVLIDSSAMKNIADDIGLLIDYEAIGQHYGLRTKYIDITRSLDVATFFACCKINEDGKWEPVKEGVGVMYRTLFLPGVNVEPVGAQIFSRPKAQQAHAVEIRNNDDFERHSGVEIFEFKHDLECSKKILDFFDGGERIMPYDLLSEKVNLIKSMKTLPEKILRKIMVSDGVQKDKIRKNLKKLDVLLKKEKGYKLSGRTGASYTKKENEEIKIKVQQIKETILSDVGIRFSYSLQ